MPVLRHLLVPLALAAVALAACQPAQPLPVPVTPQPTHTPFAFSSLYGQQIATYTPTPQPTATATPPPVFSGETFTLHLFCALSGPLSELAAARAAGFEAAVAAYNAGGGLGGVELLVQVVDTGGGQAAADALANSPAPLAVLCDAASEAALAERLRQQRIPAIGLGTSDPLGTRLHVLEPAPDDALAHWLQDLTANWRQRQPLSASSQLRLAVLSWPAELGGRALTPQLENYASSLDVELVYQAELAPQLDLNVYDALYALRDEYANVIFVNADSYGLAYVLNALSNLGVRSRVLVAAPSAAYEPVLYSYLADPAFAEGLYLVSAWDYTPQNWEQRHMDAALDVAVRALDAALAQTGSVAALSATALAQALAGVDAPDGLSIWQVGAAPGELIQVSQPVP
ncbi:MAG: ABC transporter substrate-binding protein [Anaerolineales bacterium]|nr:ABC transporter substrate-binding protein [Anaerolineales bacterium]